MHRHATAQWLMSFASARCADPCSNLIANHSATISVASSDIWDQVCVTRVGGWAAPMGVGEGPRYRGLSAWLAIAPCQHAWWCRARLLHLPAAFALRFYAAPALLRLVMLRLLCCTLQSMDFGPRLHADNSNTHSAF